MTLQMKEGSTSIVHTCSLEISVRFAVRHIAPEPKHFPWTRNQNVDHQEATRFLERTKRLNSNSYVDLLTFPIHESLKPMADCRRRQGSSMRIFLQQVSNLLVYNRDRQ